MAGDDVRTFLDSMTPVDKRVVLTMMREIMSCIRHEQDADATPAQFHVQSASAVARNEVPADLFPARRS